ncbi:hypothetical protein BDV27DRAFT_152110 [Aspergillus caelatus]|uniref:Uncharacterized protein n=1 Tax=Aspergillus caelatus TaxID=61420 RepID=A0A5N7AKX9_9EURO|nr:uncharacterized protein BDV27DRAFT_152110 [Aspergillus caelatus]KAE8370517.1 hypothetical protein BDV27DRAFT_152110 [Aspergillus caelatus]
MKWVLFYIYLLCLPVCWGVPVPGISLSDKDQKQDQDHGFQISRGMKFWRRVYGYEYGQRNNGHHESNTRILAATSSSRDTDVDVAMTMGQSQHPITLTQPPAYQSYHDSKDYTSSDNSNINNDINSNSNNDYNNNNDLNNHNNNNNNNNNPTTHGSFLTTSNTIPTQIPPSTTKRYLRVLHDTQLPTTFLKNHMHEIVVVGLFLLIPVTLALVEIIERIGLGVDEGIELEEYLQMKRGRGMIRRGRGRGRVFRKKRGKGKGKKKLKFLEMVVDVDIDIEDQALYR